MAFRLKHQWCLLLGWAAIYFLAWEMQSYILIKGDVSWLIHECKILLRGGNYFNGILEINPPLCILLYAPEIALEKIFSVSPIIGIRLYVFLSAFGSLSICYSLIKKVFPQEDTAKAVSFLVFLSFIYLILPIGEFGQRENFLIIFTMPYLFLITCRLQNKSSSFIGAAGIGLLAGIGFSIKPFFAITFILVEMAVIFVLLRKKQEVIRSVFRPESIGVITFFFIYLLVSIIFLRPYFNRMIPFALKFYYQNMGESWSSVFFQALVIFSLLSVILYWMPNQKKHYKSLCGVFVLALVGFFLSYVVQRLPLYYHFYPVFSVSLLLFFLAVTVYIPQYYHWPKNKLTVYGISALLFFYTVLYCICYYNNAYLQKKNMDALIGYLHKTEFNKPVYFFSAYTAYMVSVLEHAGSHPASQITFFSWLRNGNKNKEINDFLVERLAEDLNVNKPELIFVDTDCVQLSATHACIQIQYLNFFKKNKHFRFAWKSYSFLKTVQKKDFYRFDIYKRVEHSTHTVTRRVQTENK